MNYFVCRHSERSEEPLFVLRKHPEGSFGPKRLALRSDFRTPVESIGLQKPEMTSAVWAAQPSLLRVGDFDALRRDVLLGRLRMEKQWQGRSTSPGRPVPPVPRYMLLPVPQGQLSRCVQPTMIRVECSRLLRQTQGFADTHTGGLQVRFRGSGPADSSDIPGLREVRSGSRSRR
jgi:hypothetical protein